MYYKFTLYDLRPNEVKDRDEKAQDSLDTENERIAKEIIELQQ